MAGIAVEHIVDGRIVLMGLDGGIVRHPHGVDRLARVRRDESNFGQVSAPAQSGQAQDAVLQHIGLAAMEFLRMKPDLGGGRKGERQRPKADHVFSTQSDTLAR